MIQLILYFALGFLCAVFLAALIAPALWRRAVILTRRRIEASVPLTGDEIRAERDGLRAHHAVELRRVQLELQAANERATAVSMQHARERQEVKIAGEEREAARLELSSREDTLREAREELRRRQDRIDALAESLQKTEGQLETQRDSYESLVKQFDEASMSSSARQIELVARETEINRLVSDISTLKGRNKSTDRMARGAESRVKAVEDAMDVERKRASDLNAKLLQLLATISDRDEKLERREREIARLRERLRPILTATAQDDADIRLADLASENVRLEAEIAELNEQLDGKAQQTLAQKSDNGETSSPLRLQMAELAARVVNMTATIEGPDSPIRAILEKDAGNRSPDQSPSLADRVRAIQTATSKD